ncbi:putative 15-hydroxyprostaglandin dehydrogenase (NAD(+)) [Lupinus albus]|uniref:Putative 15-hydroxyprostaglandin dehydrogenase (NAD(+)) n=1 Tax=Lupinus albus TaxID=3870 RepID=A0A6A4Q0H2_LUPAL|nr:putative 15-hydroxyprostaglandin dehydrogenase (NAD(+)) [Lupinus albus]
MHINLYTNNHCTRTEGKKRTNMEIKPGMSALVTGAASGIGKGLVLALAEKGVFITLVDFSEEKGREVAALVQKINTKFHPNLDFPSALFLKCDVTNSRDLAAAFEKHYLTYGGLDICINSAGISNPIAFNKDQTDGTRSWKHTVNVNFTAVIECTRLAIKTMEAAKRPGAIINLGSASGLYPMYFDPIYSGSKGGVVMFTRALRPYKRQGIRINVLCPEFIETEMGLKVDPKFVSWMGGFVPMELLVKGAFELITDESKAGHCLWITNRRGLEYWPTPSEEAKYLTSPVSRLRQRSESKAPSVKLPDSFEKIIVQILSHNFRNATTIVRTPLGLPIKPKHVLVKIIYAGVNASDVNFSSGRYFGGNNSDTASRLPFDAGFEAVGIIAAVGDFVTDLKVGMPCAFMTFGGYAEFITIPSKHALPVARPDAEVVAMLTSGLTASIALEKAGTAQLESGKVVLVTAAAGGTGQFAVQLAKLAGNTVVATCGGGAKAKLLKELGADRVIDYHNEDIKTVLRKEFPKGIDVIYESVGGDMLKLCLNALAVQGRLIVIGMISQYQGDSGWTPSNYPGLLEKLLAKSQTVAGFFLVQYGHLWQEHLDKLFNLYSSGKLKVAVDPKKFVGLRSVADAVEYLHSGKSVGKVVVSVDPAFHPQVAKL